MRHELSVSRVYPNSGLVSHAAIPKARLSNQFLTHEVASRIGSCGLFMQIAGIGWAESIINGGQ